MNVLRHSDYDFEEKLHRLTTTSSLFDKTIEERTRSIIEAVYLRGDEALLEMTERFDGASLTTARLSVSTAELVTASLKADKTLRKAVSVVEKNVAAFSRKSMRRNWHTRNAQGGKVGEKFDPFQRVGLYVPGGTAPLVSTALMTITLAKVAGCPEIVVCTPCGKNGAISTAMLHAISTAGATEIYRIGGAQAIAAMALGTKSIRRVQKIFGPGNAYVVAAKRLLFGYVAVDLLPGPSEVLIVADDSANPAFVAADLLAQAEHGSGYERVCFVTTSIKLLRCVEKEVQKQLPGLARSRFVERVLQNQGWFIQVKSMEDAVALANRFAPEHCEIMTRQPGKIADQIVTAGALFLGPWSPTVVGDYIAGPSHTLPTGGAGVSFAGLTVDQFQRRTSIVEYDKSSLSKSLEYLEMFARMEGLDAHGKSAAIRLQQTKGNAKTKSKAAKKK